MTFKIFKNGVHIGELLNLQRMRCVSYVINETFPTIYVYDR